MLHDFVAELHSSCKAPSTSALPRTQLASLAGAEVCSLAAAPIVVPTSTMDGKDATHPNKCFRAVDLQLWKSYQASALAARLSCIGSKSFLLVYMKGLLQDLAVSIPGVEVPEMLWVVDALIRGTSTPSAWPVHDICGPGAPSGLALSVQCT